MTEENRRPVFADLLHAVVGLTIFRLARAVCGLPRVYRAVAGIRVRPLCPDAARVSELVAAVEYASGCMPWNCVCMDRSVVETALLRRAGFPARLTLGGRLFPLGFHAWVQLEGTAVNEAGGEYHSYSVMDVI